MNTLRNIAKKAVAVGGSVAMFATTISAAIAIDLAEYPAPFVKNGQTSVFIVVGSRAAAEDNLASLDIASGLQAAATVPVAGGSGSSTTVSGDVKQIGDSGDILEIGEQIGSVVETLTDDDLEMLGSGTISTNAGSSDYNQILDLDVAAAGSGLVKLAEDNDDNVGMFLYYDQDTPLFQYELEFPGGLDSDVDSDGNADDLEDETLFMLGQYYSIIDTDVSGVAANDTTIELIAGDISSTMQEGDVNTYTVDGKKYEVSLLFVSDSGTAKFSVNGEATDSLGDGETDTLSDGLEIGIREVLSQSRGDTGGTLVEFYLGANKIEIVDGDVSNSALDATVEINGESIDDLDADIEAAITGQASATDITINSLILRLNIDAADGQDLYLEKGQGVREMLDEPDGMLNDQWDISYEGLSAPAMVDIEFRAQSDNGYDLVFTNNNGDEYNVDFFHAFTTAGTDGVFGNEPTVAGDEDSLVFVEVDANADGDADVQGDYVVNEDDFVVLTDVGAVGAADNGDDTYVVQWTDTNEDDTEVTFEDVATGEEITAKWTGTLSPLAASPVTGDIRIGGKDFSFWMYESSTGNYQMAVDLDNSGTLENQSIVDIVVRGGGILTPSNETVIAFDASNHSTIGVSGASFFATLTTLAEDIDTNAAQSVNITFTETTDEVDLASLPATATGTWYRETDSDADVQYAVNGYGTWFEKSDDADESDSLVISYPASQVEAQVFVAGGETQKSTTTTGGSVQIVPIGDVGALDTEVTYDQKNMIVVGGPCANTMAARLMDNPAADACAEGFTPGHAVLKLFSTGRNTALLVAGYSAQDTRGAGKVLKNVADYDLAGMEADVVVSSLTNIDVMNK